MSLQNSDSDFQIPNSQTVIISPCYNENITVIKYLEELDQVLSMITDHTFTVAVVDDSSTDNTLNLLQNFNFTTNNAELRILSLRYNQGHQGAIYQGILYAQLIGANHAIVMDSDGEDDPLAIIELVKFKNEEVDIVNVARGKRKEKFSFRLFYGIYKIIYYFVTNKVMDYGNYCLINRKIIDSTAETSFIHFAGHLSKQRARFARITFDRRKRLDGKSKMNLSNLVHHAFKSFVEYAEDLLMMFLKLFMLLGFSILALVTYIVYQKVFTENAILGWASSLSASLLNSAILCLGFFVTGVLLLNIMSRRESKQREAIYKVIK